MSEKKKKAASTSSELPAEVDPKCLDLKAAPQYDITKIRDYLNDNKIQILEKLRKALPSEYLDAHASHWCTDATLCRFLRARDWDFDKALAMISNTLKWRFEYKPHLIKAEDMKSELDNKGKMYRGFGYDKWGRPILYMKPGHDNTTVDQRATKLKYLVYIMEKLSLAANKNKHEKICLIIDHKNNKHFSNTSDLKTSRETLAIMQDHYPETLGVAFMINFPYLFSWGWAIISPFIDPYTRQKVHVLNKPDKFLEFIEAEQLEIDYGGQMTRCYEYEKDWDREERENPAWSEEREREEEEKRKKEAVEETMQKETKRSQSMKEKREKEKEKEGSEVTRGHSKRTAEREKSNVKEEKEEKEETEEKSEEKRPSKARSRNNK